MSRYLKSAERLLRCRRLVEEEDFRERVKRGIERRNLISCEWLRGEEDDAGCWTLQIHVSSDDGMYEIIALNEVKRVLEVFDESNESPAVGIGENAYNSGLLDAAAFKIRRSGFVTMEKFRARVKEVIEDEDCILCKWKLDPDGKWLMDIYVPDFAGYKFDRDVYYTVKSVIREFVESEGCKVAIEWNVVEQARGLDGD